MKFHHYTMSIRGEDSISNKLTDVWTDSRKAAHRQSDYKLPGKFHLVNKCELKTDFFMFGVASIISYTVYFQLIYCKVL